MALTWRHPFTCIISGPTKCGKTQFTIKLLSLVKDVIEPPPKRILWCYGVYQVAFNELNNVEFHEGIPNLETFNDKEETLLVLDDLMHEAKDDRVSKIFTKISHHNSVSVLFLTQNLFHKSEQSRTIALNSHYLVLFKNPRDASQISHLARQMYPRNWKFLVDAFQDATSTPYSYLLLDLKSDTEENQRVRANVFTGEVNYAYIPK
jgi:hypothetical protein